MKKEATNRKKIVYVGLSGGVDSSVSAAILLSQGYNVRGVFIKVWQPDIAITGGCTWREDRLDAMRVCAKLGIPFYTLDLENEYKKEVVDYMMGEYRAGRTPNPDVMCNKYIKFGGFFDWAMKNGADYVVTGHYAQILGSKPYKLLAGQDNNKDQSYFLWTLTQEHLAKTLFPVGDLKKPQVRRLAKKFGLLTAEKKDSQGLCFIGKVNMADFLKNFIKKKEGKVLNEKGEIIGKHDGVFYFTIGQRHGFTVYKKETKEKAYYIMAKNLKNNTLVVSHGPLIKKEASGKEIRLININWVAGREPGIRKAYQARIRYRQPPEKCHLKQQNLKWTAVFNRSQKSPTPGQSVVFYDGRNCLGGGVIE